MGEVGGEVERGGGGKVGDGWGAEWKNRNSLFHKREKPWVRGSDWGGCGGDGTATAVALNNFPGCDRNFAGTAS